MKLYTQEQYNRMIENGQPKNAGNDHLPVIKLFNPCGAATWILTELDPENPNIAFGLCDLGMGFPELGSVDLEELASLKGPLGIGIERDLYFEPTHRLMTYARAAWHHQHITENDKILERFVKL